MDWRRVALAFLVVSNKKNIFFATHKKFILNASGLDIIIII